MLKIGEAWRPYRSVASWYSLADAQKNEPLAKAADSPRPIATERPAPLNSVSRKGVTVGPQAAPWFEGAVRGCAADVESLGNPSRNAGGVGAVAVAEPRIEEAFLPAYDRVILGAEQRQDHGRQPGQPAPSAQSRPTA